MKIEEVTDPYCLWIETLTGVLVLLGSIEEICGRCGIRPVISYKELKKQAPVMVDNKNTKLITVKEFLKKKEEMEKIGKHITII